MAAVGLATVDDIHFAWFTEQADRFVTLHGTLPALAVFDVLTKWFATQSFCGCPFINSSLQVGATNERAQRAVPELMILMEGAIVTAAVEGDRLAAVKAARAARAPSAQWSADGAVADRVADGRAACGVEEVQAAGVDDQLERLPWAHS
jgi:hypothetical protein